MVPNTREEFLESLSQDALAELNHMRKHEFTCYSWDGTHQPHHDERQDLFELLSQKDVYVVDNHAKWRTEAGKPEHRDKAFIIGRTLMDEQYNLEGLLFGSRLDIRNNNVFCLGYLDGGERGHLMQIERIDSALRPTMDEASLAEESLPKSERTAPKFQEREIDSIEKIREQKKVMLLLLGVTAIEQVENRAFIAPRRKLLSESIKNHARTCYMDRRRAIDVARQCYALLLTSRKNIRTEFSDDSNRNVFGDMNILLDALYLQAKILSKDAGLKEMASYAGIECVDEIK